VSSRRDAHLSIVPAVRTTCHTVRTPFSLKHHPSRQCSFPSGSSFVSRSFYSSLHLSERLNSQSGKLSVFDQALDFLSKSKYGKIVATVWTMWILIWTRYSLSQVRNSNSTIRTPVYHGPDARSTDMEIACSRSPVRTAILLVRTCEAFIRKLFAADMWPFGLQGNTVRTRILNMKDFQGKSQNFGRRVVKTDGLCPLSARGPTLSSQMLI